MMLLDDAVVECGGQACWCEERGVWTLWCEVRCGVLATPTRSAQDPVKMATQSIADAPSRKSI